MPDMRCTIGLQEQASLVAKTLIFPRLEIAQQL